MIFDLDGVIVDSHPVHRQAWKAFLQSVGKNVSEHDLEFILEGAKRDDILRHYLGELTGEQLVEYGKQKDAAFHVLGKEMHVVDGVLEFIAGLESANIPIALGSSAHRKRVEYTLEKLQLRHRFAAIVTGDDVAIGKPDPAIFHKAADAWNAPPHCILVCEDSVNGVAAAKNAGMKCLGIGNKQREPRLRSAGADQVIPNFTVASLMDVLALKL
ncbi:MAG TPA: HAD family phosphatase [Candidatus Angelobacter sp.]|nr:HAD family phosphatase [Candidatus Angelobacter sp.]